VGVGNAIDPKEQLRRLPTTGDVIVDRYQLEEKIGRGGMGVVYAARHLTLRQRVAVKFLVTQSMEGAEAAARFVREARTAAAIQSQHVVRVLDVGALETGALYMVMEFLSGKDLAQVLRGHGPLACEEAADIVLEASEAIGEAHALGIVHRDLKPANLFLADHTDGTSSVKVLDFGLSKVLLPEGEVDERLTEHGRIMGSPHYMSPEQVRNAQQVDWRTDIWALGAILYHALSGHRPFDGPNAAAIYVSIATDEPKPITDHRPDTPAALKAIVRRCLEKDVGKRFQSVAELVKALKPYGTARGRLAAQKALALRTDLLHGAQLSDSSPSDSRTAASGRFAALRSDPGAREVSSGGGRAPTPPPSEPVSEPLDELQTVSLESDHGSAPTHSGASSVVAVQATGVARPRPQRRGALLTALGAAALLAAVGVLLVIRSSGAPAPATPAVTASAQPAPPAAASALAVPPAPERAAASAAVAETRDDGAPPASARAAPRPTAAPLPRAPSAAPLVPAPAAKATKSPGVYSFE
jgi:serine/threonine-protein kinase